MSRTDSAPVCPRIQIAGVIDAAEAAMLTGLGVDSLGFPLRLAVHAEDLTEQEAAAIVTDLPPHVAAVVITYLTDADAILTLCDTVGTPRVQLHADVPPQLLATLKERRPDLRIIKSLIVPPEVTPDAMVQLAQQVRAYAEHADAFLTDSFDPATGATGATGHPHDWRVDRELVRLSPRPVILAGGLHPGNVAEAIATARPAAVDAHTGVEAPNGRKSRTLVTHFVTAAQEAFAALGE